jgi:hypothetical protein
MVTEEKQYIVFSSLVMSVAEKRFKAGTSHEEAEPFVRSLFEKYLKCDLDPPALDWITLPPKKTKSWIVSELSNCFQCCGEVPKWVDEPSWRYIGDQPMSFAHQFEVTAGDESFFNVVTYVFFGKKFDSSGGWELVTKLIQQDKGESGTAIL